MRRRSGARRATSLGMAGLAGAAALVSALGAAPATAAQAKPASATAGQHLLQTPQQASAQAIRTGTKVPVTGSTTPDSALTANPNGTFTLTESDAPVRAKVGGRWRNLDASLVRNADGTYSPTVSSQPLALSGGGTGPLATMTDGTYSLALTAPMSLPAPVIAGNTATYDSVLPGVDLIVTAQPSGGFSEVLRIATAKAAANPALQALTFTTTTKGVTLKTAGNGAIAAVDRTGQAIFAAPAPQMWDSANTPAQRTSTGNAAAPAGKAAESTTAGPGAGAHTGALGVSLAGGRITLTPDRQLLTGAGVVYPEYLDPTWDAAGSAASTWAYVSQQYPGTSYYDTDMTLQVGQDPDATSYTSYSFYTLPLPSQVDGAVIDTAYAYFPEVWADSCTASPVQLWLTGTISGNTTWNNQPAWDSEQGQLADVAYGWSPSGEAGGPPPSGDPGCGDNDVAFTVTSAVTTGAADGWPTVTVGLKASDTSDATGWKQFADPDSSPSGNATLSITYADTPATPVLSTSPAANCATGTSVVGNGYVNLDATVSDVNGTATGSYTVSYAAYADGNTADTFDPSLPASVSAASGTIATVQVSAAYLGAAVEHYGSNPADPADPNDQVTITWTASVSDGVSDSTTGVTVPSSPTASCTFIFSTAVPGQPQIEDSKDQPCDTAPPAGASYVVGSPAPFSLEPNGSSTAAPEPTSYIYQLNGGNPVIVPAGTSPPYSATISVTPTGFTNTLTVEAAIAGTNIGQPASCTITASPPEPAADQDLTGDGIPDLLTVGNGTNGLPQGLWLANGQPGSKGFDGTVDTTATDIARIGPQDTGPNSWTGMKVITGQFGALPGFNDVEAYDPSTCGSAPPQYAGDVYILQGNGNGTLDTSQDLQLTNDLDDNNLVTGNTNDPVQLVNAYHVSGDTTNSDADQIGLFDDPQAGAYLGYFVNNNGDNTFSEYQLTNTTPDNSMDWCDWTITTANATPGEATGTNMWLWNQTTGALYRWQLTGLTPVSGGGCGLSGCTNPTATLDGTLTEIVPPWDEGTTFDTFQATEINGEPGLITVNGSGQVQSYAYNGTTLTQAGTTQQLLTADHTYLLDQASAGYVDVNTPAPTDQPGAGDSEQDLAAPADNTGTSWNTSDDVYNPDVAFNGSSTSYLASSGPTFNPSTSFTISAWVNLNPSSLGGTVFSQNGTDDSSIEVSSTTGGQWSMSMNTAATTSDSYATASGGIARPGMWTDLTLTYDNAGNTDLLDLYANGVQVASLYDAAPPTATGPFVLGASQVDGSYGSYFAGQLADVQVWDSLAIPFRSRASIAWTGTSVVITATDSSGNLDYWWEASGTGTWHEQQVAAASTTLTYQNPSIAWTGTSVVITATDSSGNLDYWWQASGTGVWNQQQVAAASTTLTYQNPSIAWTGTSEVITATDSSGNLDYWWQASGTAPWNEQQVAVGG
jgi:hypothetical protein